MRDALSLTDQAIAFGSGRLDEAGVRQMLGSVDRSHVLLMIRALTEGDGAAVLNQVNALRLQGVSAAAGSRLSILIFHRVLPQADPLFPVEVDAARFDRLMGLVARSWQVLPLAEAVERLAQGTLPPRALGLVAEWASLHQQDLSGLWNKARRAEPLGRIDPLP